MVKKGLSKVLLTMLLPGVGGMAKVMASNPRTVRVPTAYKLV